MARNKKVEILSHDGQVLHPITDGDCVIFPDGETLTHKLSEDEAVMYTPEVVNSSPMFKVGEGDSSDYSANVLDGAYQEAVLKGQTYVNTIQEPSADVITLPTPFTEYERTQSKTFTEMQDGTFGLNLVGQSYVNCIQEPSEPSYVALGENLEFQNKKVEYTTDGQIKSAMLNGMTLVNVIDYTNSVNGRFVKNGDTLTISSNESSTWYNDSYRLTGITYGKTYRVMWDSLTYTHTDSHGIEQIIGAYSSNANNEQITIAYISNDNFNYFDFTVPSNSKLEDVAIRVHATTFTGEQGAKTVVKGLKVIEYQNGMESWDIPYFEGMQSVTMSTGLDNVCSRYNSSGAKNGKTFTVGTWETRGLTLSTTDNIAKYNFKPNTKYLVQFKVTNLNLDGLSSIGIAFSDGEVSTGNSLFGDNALVEVKSNGIYRVILTTSNVISTSNFVVKGLKNQWENSTSTARRLTISQIMCIEYQNGMENWDLPYFETTQLMKPFKVRTMSKNLCPVGKGQFFNCFFKAGTRFTLSTKDGIASNGGNIVFKDKDGNSMRLGIDSGASISRTTLAKDAYQIVNQLNSEAIQYQLEEGTSVTSFVPREEKTTSALEPITLRATGDAIDTLDLSTGEYIQRVGEVLLDGSQNWYLDTVATNADTTIFYTDENYNGFKLLPDYADRAKYNKCDKLPVVPGLWNANVEGIMSNQNGKVYIAILKSRLSSQTVDSFKSYLASNPIRFVSILANPITRKISLEYPNLQTYTDITHVQSIAMDGTLIPNIYLPSDISYKAMLKPNTSYNVIIDREVVDSTNQLTVNLGGTTANITANRTVVRTPSTLSNETLTFSGKDNRLAKVMLIEGSTLINGNLPHFDGIGDVKLGRVVENLCIANEILAGSATTTSTLYTDRIEIKITKEGSCVETFELTKQLQNGKKYFVYCPWNCSNSSHIFGAGFRMSYNGGTSYAQQVEGVGNKKYIIFTINADNEKGQLNPYTHFTIGFHGSMAVNTTMTIRRPILCEYIDGMENWDWESIGYFTGTRNIGNEFMRIGNKNLVQNEEALRKANLAQVNVTDVSRLDVKPNTSYYVGLTLQNGIQPNTNYFTVEYKDINGYIVKYAYHNGLVSFTEEEAKKIKYVNIYTNKEHGESNVYVDHFWIEESSSATSYIAHKHNSLYISPNEQIPLTFVQGRIDYTKGGSWTNATNNTATQVIRTDLLDLEPNETYRVSCGNSNYKFAIGMYDNSSLGSSVVSYSDKKECYIATTKDVHKMGIAVTKTDSSNITPSALHQVRLEKVTDVTLRSVGDVKDELDLTRGVYIQRIKEVVFDGSDDEKWNASSSQGYFSIYTGDAKAQSASGNSIMVICDKYTGKLQYSVANDKEDGICTQWNTTELLLLDSTIELNVDSLRKKLQQNPIRVQYVLETPIEHKINIPMKNESNQTIAKPNGIFTLPLMYSGNNHVDINSQIYPKVQSRDYIAYPVIASPSNKYTVFHNKVGSTDLTVNLCGASTTVNAHKNTITTPSSISQYELRLSGATNKVSNICVFNGDYMNVNVPYVEGMMNAVNPIVKNTGKNLFDGVVKDGESWWEGAVQNGSNSLRRSVNLAPVKPNTKYSFKLSNKQNGGANFMAHDKKGKYLKYIGWVRQDVGKFTTPSNCYYIHWYNDIDSFTDFQIEGTPTQSQYEPYKENNCEPENGQIKLTKDMFEQGTVSGANGIGTKYEVMKENSTVRLRSKDIIRVKPNTSYRLFRENGYTGWCVAYDSNKGYLGKTYDTEVFTTDSQTCYIVPVLRNISGTTMTLDKVEKFRLVEVDETIHLRSLPNGVRDELNLETGEYVQRVGEITFDGSETGWDGNAANNNTFRIRCNVAYINNTTIHAICKEYESRDYQSSWDTGKFISVSLDKKITFRNDNIPQGDTASWKAYLQANPITVQYQLETPIIKHIDIHNYPHSYKDGHVIIESNDPSTNVSAQLTYQCVTNRSGQIQEHTEQVEKQEKQINELETLILENIRQNQNRSQNFLTSLISTLEIEEE